MSRGTDRLYRETGPTRLAAPPQRFSHSMLRVLRTCPRRWQLLRSTWAWGESYPERPTEAILRGHVVHRALETLVDRLCAAGAPPFGSAEFLAVGQAFHAERGIQAIYDDECANFAGSPRSHGLGEPRVTLAECQNAVVRLLRATWDAGPRRARPMLPHVRTPRPTGALARPLDPRPGDRLPEVELAHPTLPLIGTADLVAIEEDGDIVVDYKTGATRPEHAEQVRLYALLWWRMTGRLPRLLRVVSSDGGPPTEILGHAEDLTRLERDLAAEIASWRLTTAESLLPAQPGTDNCRFCGVRQVCDDYWVSPGTTELRWSQIADESGLRDVELQVTSVRSACSVRGRLAVGAEVTLVSDAAAWSLEDTDSLILRALGVARASEGTLSTTRLTEVFRSRSGRPSSSQ